MKKLLPNFLTTIIAISVIFLILNINVATRKGINYQWKTINLPLYLKLLDFFDRHYNYRHLVKGIIADTRTKEERVIKIFEWTYNNLKKIPPQGLPIIDDHVWYIIVRGYGVEDQFSDVFTTLCNYSSMDAFYNLIYKKNRTAYIYVSFVKLNKRWSVFDPYYGVYFKNKNGDITTVDEIKNGDWTIVNIGTVEKNAFDYKEFLDNLPDTKEIGLKRANIQSPLRRFIYGVSKWIE